MLFSHVDLSPVVIPDLRLAQLADLLATSAAEDHIPGPVPPHGLADVAGPILVPTRGLAAAPYLPADDAPIDGVSDRVVALRCPIGSDIKEIE
jgi:hypothetical protein